MNQPKKKSNEIIERNNPTEEVMMNQQIIDQPSEDNFCNPIYVRLPYISESPESPFTAESVFAKHEKWHSLKEFSAVLALMSLADYEDGLVYDQYKLWFDAGCFKTISPTFIEDIDDLDKFEQAKLMQMICSYILEVVGNESTKA